MRPCSKQVSRMQRDRVEELGGVLLPFWRRRDRLRSIQGNKAHNLLVPGNRRSIWLVSSADRFWKGFMAYDSTAGRMRIAK
jgi:hypothetical protein